MKNDIISKAREDGISKSIFKSSRPNCMSLTVDGFEYMKAAYPETYVLKFEDITASDLSSMQKLFKVPYFIDYKKKSIYHYDELLDIQSKFYKNDLRRLFQSCL